MSTPAPQLPIRSAKGPEQGNSYAHSYCPNCNRLYYSLNTYGPMLPAQINRTFCVCDGKVTGIVKSFKTTYDLEDVLSPAEAKKERDDQTKPEYREATRTNRPKF